MRWHKFISSVLHPIVMPTIGVLLYYMVVPLNINKPKLYALFSIIFIATYAIPLLLLIFLKSKGHINSYEVHSIKERRIPLFFMTSIFLILGKFFFDVTYLKDLSYLYFGTALGLIFIYFIFKLKIKTSLHLLSMGSAVGFFLMIQLKYQTNIWPLISILILLSGLLASSRLKLKAHISKEVYLGFLLGIFCQVIINYLL
jgi:membrane-associated phospholipid phosphatase